MKRNCLPPSLVVVSDVVEEEFVDISASNTCKQNTDAYIAQNIAVKIARLISVHTKYQPHEYLFFRANNYIKPSVAGRPTMIFRRRAEASTGPCSLTRESVSLSVK